MRSFAKLNAAVHRHPAGRAVQIEDCTVRGFTSNAAQGIRIASTLGFTTVNVSDTVLANNGLGIFALGSQGVLVDLDHVKMYNNSFGGFRASGANGGVSPASLTASPT
jgi:hypothetical protein